MEPTPLKTFIIYASKDKDLREELERHLRPLADLGWLEVWSDKEIMPGERWDAAIKKNLLQAEVFLMLVSVDFYNSGYIREEEFKTAIARLESGDALILPIIIRHCTWKYYPIIKDLQVLPPGGIAVTDLDHWKHRDKAWDAVVNRIGERVEALHKERAGAALKAGEEAGAERLRQAEEARIAKAAAEKQAREEAERLRQAEEARIAKAAAEKQAREEAERRRQAEEAKRAKAAAEKQAREEAERLRRAEEARQQPKNGQTQRDFPDSPEMVFVEGGAFKMGSNDFDDEKPIHDVTVPSFWIGKYPVTFEEYDSFCKATNRKKPNDEGWGRGRRPVINVSWDDAQAYCDWLSQKSGKKYRLPAEAEWEFAVRGGTLSKGYKFAGGNDLDRVGWYVKNAGGKTHPVGEKAANELGLYDMSGNVWEWCADYWHDNYKNAPDDGSAWTLSGDDSTRCLRGGSWGDPDSASRLASRDYLYSETLDSAFGFRLARHF